MKLAYYLRGLGTGIMITALLLGIYNNLDNKAEWTDLEIMRKAEELGMIKEEDTLNLDSLAPRSSDRPKDPLVQPSELPKQEEKQPTLAPTSTPMPPSKLTSDGTSHKLENSTHKIYLPQGLNSKDIAVDLEVWKVIDDAEEFDRYLTTSGYDRKIGYGNFTIPSGASYDKIAKILTRPDE